MKEEETELSRRSKRTGAHYITSALLAGLATAMIILSSRLPNSADQTTPGIGVMPTITGVVMIATAMLLLVFPGENNALPRTTSAIRVVSMLGVLLAYVGLLAELGFVVATTVFLVLCLLLKGERRPKPLVAYPVCTSVVLFYVFYALMEVALPVGVVELSLNNWIPS